MGFAVCPLCKRAFGESTAYRDHLAAAHGLYDDDGAETVVEPDPLPPAPALPPPPASAVRPAPAVRAGRGFTRRRPPVAPPAAPLAAPPAPAPAPPPGIGRSSPPAAAPLAELDELRRQEAAASGADRMALDRLRAALDRVHAAESAAVEAVAGATSQTVADLAAERHRLVASAQMDGRARATAAEAMSASLASHRIADAGLPGIGPELASRLAWFGIVTAADVDPERGPVVAQRPDVVIAGLDAKAGEALLAWRRSLERPAATASAASQADAARFRMAEAELQRREAEARADGQRRIEAAREPYRKERERIEAEVAALTDAAAVRRAQLDRRLVQLEGGNPRGAASVLGPPSSRRRGGR